MFTKNAPPFTYLVLIVFFISFGMYYSRIMPYQFSGIDPINPEQIGGEFDQAKTEGVFHGRKVISGQVLASKMVDVLGTNNENKRIEVDLTNQRVYAYEGDNRVYEFVVSTGKWGRTPTGTFRIWGKNKYAKMSGGNQALGTYYYLPNVPFIMWFAGDGVAASRGYSLHGTYWHSNFGYPMSHGCVNMRTEDAQTLFYWSSPVVGEANSTRSDSSDPGTQVIIYGVAPDQI